MITGRGAFFISPEGEVINVSDTQHIHVITDNPEKFGLSLEEIRGRYRKYNERMGIEGKAREEIIMDVIEKGWVHIRKKINKPWIINAYEMNEITQNNLSVWAKNILEGMMGVQELNKNAPVEIRTINNNYECTISELIRGINVKGN